MSPKTRAVYFKELRDSLRDRRTVFATVVIPLLLYPIMLLLTAEVSQIAHARLEREVHEIAIPEGSRSIFEMLQKLPESERATEKAPKAEKLPAIAKALPLDSAPEKKSGQPLKFTEFSPERAEQALTSGVVRAIVVLEKDFVARVMAGETLKIEVRYDQAEQRSRDASERVHNLFDRYRERVVDERLTSRGLSHAMLEPFSVKTVNVAQATKVGGSIVGIFMPLLFIMMIITGAIHPAIDMTAGEKERSTLETLIGSPVRPSEIITGKFLAVATWALGNAALNVGSFAFTFSIMPLPKQVGFEFPWAALPLTLLLLLPLALFFAGLLLAVASFAANQKEAQIYCMPIFLIPVLGLFVVMMPGIELEGPLLLVPVLNTSLLIKELFLARGNAQQIVFVFCSTCFYAAGAVVLAARVFAREEVLFSAQGSLRLFLNRRFFRAAKVPKPGDALLVAALIFPINFYFQVVLQKLLLNENGAFSAAGFALAVGVPIWLIFGVLPMLVAWYLKLDRKSTFLLNTPTMRAMFAAALLGCSSWIIAQQLAAWQSHIWEYSALEMEALEKPILELMQSTPGMLLIVFLIGATPGICEEFFFRGFLQQGVTRKNKWAGLLTVGIIFGAFHFPLWRQPVVMLIGVVLAYVAFETQSIWPGVLYHFLHNSLGLIGPGLLKWKEEKHVAGTPLHGMPMEYLIPAVVMFGAGLLLVRGAARKTPPQVIVITENEPVATPAPELVESAKM